MKFFHGSPGPLAIGLLLGKRRTKTQFRAEVEQYLEDLRPEGMASRIDGVFMSSKPSDVEIARGEFTPYVYEVMPVGGYQAHNIYWLGEIQSRHFPFRGRARAIGHKSEELALNYWRGLPEPVGSRLWREPMEYLAERAKVIRGPVKVARKFDE